MKYMMLIYEDDAARVANMDEWMPHCSLFVEDMRKAGVYVTGDRLRGVTTANTVRVSNGKTQVLDGPFAETKEQLGGYHIIEVPDLDAALQWAARCPSAGRGAVEIRPVWPL